MVIVVLLHSAPHLSTASHGNGRGSYQQATYTATTGKVPMSSTSTRTIHIPTYGNPVLKPRPPINQQSVSFRCIGAVGGGSSPKLDSIDRQWALQLQQGPSSSRRGRPKGSAQPTEEVCVHTVHADTITGRFGLPSVFCTSSLALLLLCLMVNNVTG